MRARAWASGGDHDDQPLQATAPIGREVTADRAHEHREEEYEGRVQGQRGRRHGNDADSSEGTERAEDPDASPKGKQRDRGRVEEDHERDLGSTVVNAARR